MICTIHCTSQKTKFDVIPRSRFKFRHDIACTQIVHIIIFICDLFNSECEWSYSITVVNVVVLINTSYLEKVVIN